MPSSQFALVVPHVPYQLVLMSCLGSGDAGKENAMGDAKEKLAQPRNISIGGGTPSLGAISVIIVFALKANRMSDGDTPFYKSKISSHIVNRYQTK